MLQANGLTVYFRGDTLLIPKLSEIPQRFPQVDVALLAVNGLQIRFLGNKQDRRRGQVVMNPQDATELCHILKPRYAFTGGPVLDALVLKHSGTPQEFQRAAAQHAPETTVRILDPGEPLQVTA